MNNSFQRLLVREFGQRLYRKMVSIIISDEKDHLIHPELTELLCAILLRRSCEELKGMGERMEEAMMRSYHISRSFWPFAAFCSLVIVALFLFVEPVAVLVASVAAVSACALWRTGEYLVNRYCYVDARIILCYRVALVEVRNSRKCTS